MVLPTPVDARFAVLAACVFGEFPTGPRQAFLSDAYVNMMDAKEISFSASDFLKLFSRDSIFPLRVGTSELDVYHSSFHLGPMLFYMKEDSAADLIGGLNGSMQH